jgi:hypothetical protein
MTTPPTDDKPGAPVPQPSISKIGAGVADALDRKLGPAGRASVRRRKSGADAQLDLFGGEKKP